MLERYTRPEMGKIWSDENKYEAWLKVEIAATNAWSELGEVPQEDAAKIAQNASFTPARVAELEQITHPYCFRKSGSREKMGALWFNFD